jgi:CRP-like cAMP-binding protein
MESPYIQQPFRNRILASLPASDLARLAPHLSPRTFKKYQTLYDQGQIIEAVYFLEDGICSIVVTMENGSTVEVGMVGREGFTGATALLGGGNSPYRSLIQIAGTGYAIKAKTLVEQFREGSSQLRVSLQRSIQAIMVQISQTAACNRVHELEERLARRLLMCHDRVQVDELPITHESMAMMLGTRRSSVTMAAGILQKAGLIKYSHGHVHIENRKGLEKAACECYSVIRDEYARLGLP